MSSASEKQKLRKLLRQKRSSLSETDQRIAAENLRKNFVNHNLHQGCDQIGCYFPNEGEISPLPIADWLEVQGALCFLPIIDSSGESSMRFGRYSKHSSLQKNRFGIPEPKTQQTIEATQLDLILIPLVGFDQCGNRIGMGKGFYDRTLATLDRATARTKLVGIAHQCQRVNKIDPEDWDISLDAILTDAEFIRCSR